jgi:hypothetical protein
MGDPQAVGEDALHGVVGGPSHLQLGDLLEAEPSCVEGGRAIEVGTVKTIMATRATDTGADRGASADAGSSATTGALPASTSPRSRTARRNHALDTIDNRSIDAPIRLSATVPGRNPDAYKQIVATFITSRKCGPPEREADAFRIAGCQIVRRSATAPAPPPLHDLQRL